MVPETTLSGGTGENSGKVWIKDGKLFVKNPVSGGTFAAVTPCPEVSLLVNGKIVDGRTTVSESDELVLKPNNIEEPGFFKTRVAPGGLSAVLEIKAGVKKQYFVQDSAPETDLLLKVVSRSEASCPFTLTEIMNDLAGKNISFGIKHDEIQRLIKQPESGLFLLAEGEPPGETVNERIELCFSAETEDQKSAESDKVDFRNVSEIPSVDPGTLLVVKHFAVQGNPGKKVNGEIIPPAKPQVFELAAGKGVEISPDGSRAVAKIGGRPVVKKLGTRYIIDVEPVLQKKGDVDISSGNIRFKGDVVVHGNVCEGMTVHAAGKINILGMIYQARIAAQGDITAMQNLTGSSIVAGGSNSFFKSFNKVLESLYGDFIEILKMIPGLASHPKLKDVKTGQLIQLLIDKRHLRIPALIAEMIKLSEQNSFILPREIADLTEKAEKKLSGLNLLKLESIDEFQSFIDHIKVARQVLEGMARERANITFGYSVNSKIEASGNVKVEGRGCINTTIHAGGNVNVKGVFRGGEITARGDIFLNEAGSEMGARTTIKTEDGKKIFIKKAFAGVQIQVGNRRANLNSVQRNVRAELDEDGSLSISSASKY